MSENVKRGIKKLASSNDFDEIKSFAEKIGTNRRLLDRKLIFDFQKPFDFVPKYTEKCERSPATDGASDLSAVALAKAGPTNCLQNSQCLSWSQLLNEVRTFFEQNPE